MALDQGFGGLGGLGSLFGGSGGGGSGGMNDMLIGAALLDAGRAQTAEQRKPLMQTIAPIIQMQQQQQQLNAQRTALEEAMVASGVPRAQAKIWAWNPEAAKLGVDATRRTGAGGFLGDAVKGEPKLDGSESTPPATGQKQSAVEPPAQLAQLFSAKEQEHGLPAGYLGRTAQIESNFDPAAVSPTGARGPFQFTSGTANQYNLTNPHDWNASTDAAARLAKDNAASLKATLGRDPTPAELYLAHQQGADGAANLLRFPDVPASTVVPAKNIAVNGGRPDMKAGDFANLWLNKFGQLPSGSREGPQMAASADLPAQGAQTADLPATGSGNAAFYIPGTDPAQRVNGAGAPVQVAQASTPGTATDAPQPGVGVSPVIQALNDQAPRSPETVTGPSTQRAAALKNFDYWVQKGAEASLRYGADGAGIAEAAKQKAALAAKFLDPTDIEKAQNAADSAKTPEARAAILNAIPDTRPEAVRIGALGLNPATKPLYDKAIEVKQAGARTGEDAFSQGVGSEAAKIVGKAMQVANGYDDAYKMHNQLDLMEQAARDPKVMQGAGGTIWLGIQKAAQSLGKLVGMETDDLKIANAEQLNKFARQYASQQAKAGVGARVTNFELDTFLKSNAGNDTSQLGNIRLIGILKQDAERQMAISNATADLIGTKKEETSISAIRKIARDYDAAHPLLDPITGDPVSKLAAESGPAKASDAGAEQPQSNAATQAPVKVFTKKDYDKLAPGDTYIDPTGKTRKKGGPE